MSHQQCIPSSPRMTYGNNRQMLQSYYVSSTMYTVISKHDIRKLQTDVTILLCLINNVYRDLHERNTESIDRCYNLFMSHQQCIPSSPRTTYGNYRQMLQSYYVSSTMYTVISTHDIRILQTDVTIFLCLINNVYRHLHARRTETIDRCYNLIMSHQQCIQSSPRTTYGNCRQMLQSYYVSSTMYTVISTHDVRKLQADVTILLCLINNVYRHLHARHTETLDSCFNLMRSHQQCIP